MVVRGFGKLVVEGSFLPLEISWSELYLQLQRLSLVGFYIKQCYILLYCNPGLLLSSSYNLIIRKKRKGYVITKSSVE